MSTNLTIAINVDTQDLSYETSGVDWVEMDTDNDFLIFTQGSDVVKDGEPVPSSSDLNQAGVVLTGLQIIVDKYFLADISADELKQINNMGNQNKRYVIAFVFDGSTASEPVLELWDDTGLDSINNISLGSGSPSNSWWKGITTTDALPGVDWIGSSLAGSSDGHFLWLNDQDGALDGASILYCNLKIVIPASASQSGAEAPVFAVKYTTN